VLTDNHNQSTKANTIHLYNNTTRNCLGMVVVIHSFVCQI